jgi:hypothetical protein
MLDRLSDAATVEAARAAYMLHFFWRARGAVAEEHERLRALLARDDLPHRSRAALLVRLSDVDMHVGRVDASEVAAREALALAEPGTEPHYLALSELAFYSIHRGDAAEAVRLGRQAAEEAETLDDASRIQAMGNLAGILAGVMRTDEARALLKRFVHEARRTGLVALETIGLAELGEYKLIEHEYESARAAYAAVLTQLRSNDTRYYEVASLKGFWARVTRPGAPRRSPRCVFRDARAGTRRDGLALVLPRRRPLVYRPCRRTGRRGPCRPPPRRRRSPQQRRRRGHERVPPTHARIWNGTSNASS